MNSAEGSDRKRVAVVGCGNIGSRSLQALAKLGGDVQLYAVDPSQASLDLARQRVGEISEEAENTVRFQNSHEDLPSAIDLLLVSTCSDNRLVIARQVLEASEVRNLVLEKFLFQRHEEYAEMQKLLERHGPKCWVCLPRRTWPGYAELGARMGEGQIHMSATGYDFRLASNAIHLVDIFAHVSGSNVSRFDATGLEDGPASSKRSHYRELYGTLVGDNNKGGRLTLTSFQQGSVPFVVQFVSPTAHCIIREEEQSAWLKCAETSGWEEIPFPVLYMSDMAPTYGSILSEGTCGLPTYDESAAAHLALLEVFNRHWHGERWKEVSCPIT